MSCAGEPSSPMRARLDQRDALGVVHHVQRLALQRVRRRVPAVDLEAAEVDPLVLAAAPCGQLGHLAHALPGRVVDVPGPLALPRVPSSSAGSLPGAGSSAVGRGSPTASPAGAACAVMLPCAS